MGYVSFDGSASGLEIAIIPAAAPGFVDAGTGYIKLRLNYLLRNFVQCNVVEVSLHGDSSGQPTDFCSPRQRSIPGRTLL